MSAIGVRSGKLCNFAAAMESILNRLSDLLVYDAASPMLFNSGLFLVLFLLFLLVYQAVQGHRRIKMLLVIAFSLYFYYKSSQWCVAILCGVCLSDYLLGLWLGRASAPWLRHGIVALNVVLNVGMLVYFKYANLLLDAFTSIRGSTFDPLDVILPAGISFFTFRSISYMVDIYRGQLSPCRSLLDYTFYLTFFPPLLAGPVVRAKDMLPQVEANVKATPQMMSEGLFLIMTGLLKKVVIADYISGNFVDRIFDNPMLYSGFENLIGCIGFTIQLYCDFSGYSDMAIGVAPLAHLAIHMASRLCLHTSRRKPPWPCEGIRQPVCHHGNRRPVARSLVDVYNLGCISWPSPGIAQGHKTCMEAARATYRPSRSQTRQYHNHISAHRSRVYYIPRTIA